MRSHTVFPAMSVLMISGGLHQVAGQFPAGALEMLRIHVGFGGVIVEALNEEEFPRVGG